jgi:predicted acylesterase/phospholipase RssA
MTGATPNKELRLAIAMRGGVSLAVWIGGALAEIEALRLAAFDEGDSRRSTTANAEIYRQLLHDAGYSKVRVDVMSGTSAGGLNGAIYAACLLYGIDFSKMADIWVELADLEKMIRVNSTQDGRPVDSLLEGDAYFQANLTRVLSELPRLPTGQSGELHQDYVDLVLTGTLIEPINEPLVGAVDGAFDALRSAAFFQFHHEEGNSHFDNPTGSANETPAVMEKLALAGRTSSSFPFAFEPATVSTVSTTSDASPNMVGVFSERSEKPFRVMDGGVLDNIPIARAIEAIAASPAATPTDRWLLYLYPSPPPVEKVPATDDASPSRPRPVRALSTVRQALSAILSIETIRDDVVVLERHNREVEFQDVRWRSLWSGVTLEELRETSEQATFVDNRSDLDGRRLRTMLELPNQHLAGKPIAVTAPAFQGLVDVFGPAGRELGKEFQRRVQAIYHNNFNVLRIDAQTVQIAVDLLIGACREVERFGSATKQVEASRLKSSLYTYRRGLTVAITRRDISLLTKASIGQTNDSPASCSSWIQALLIDDLVASAADEPSTLEGHLALVREVLDGVSARWPWSLLGHPDVTVDDLLAMARRAVAMGATSLQNSAKLELKIVSGAEPTPLASMFAAYQTNAEGTLATADKLAGNELGNFAAFLDARWRVNDWAWGRADAAARLARSLHEQRIPGDPASVPDIESLVATLQRNIWSEELPRIEGLRPESLGAGSGARGGGSPEVNLEDKLQTYAVGSEGVRDLPELDRARLAMRIAKIGVAAILPTNRGPRTAVQLLRPTIYAAAFALAAGKRAGICVGLYAMTLAIWWHRALAGWGWQKHAPFAIGFIGSAGWALVGLWRQKKDREKGKRVRPVAVLALVSLNVASAGLLLTSIAGRVPALRAAAPLDSPRHVALLPGLTPSTAWLLWPGWIVVAATVLAALGTFWMRSKHRWISVALTPSLYVVTAIIVKAIDRKGATGWWVATWWKGFPLGWWIVASLIATAFSLAAHVTRFDVFPPRPK